MSKEYPECSGDPESCPENEGRGCCKPNTDNAAPGGDVELMAREIIADWHRKKGCDQQVIDDCLSGDITVNSYMKDLLIAALSAPKQVGGSDIYEAYKSWPADIRKKLSLQDLRRMSGWAPRTAVSDWRIDTSAGGPILVYQNCSVIEGEQARYVLGLIEKDSAPQPVEAEGRGEPAWLVESGDYRQIFTIEATAKAQVWELRKKGYEASITPTPLAQPEQPAIDPKDAERLDWLLENVSSKEMRDLGIDKFGPCTRADLDDIIDGAKGEQPHGAGRGGAMDL